MRSRSMVVGTGSSLAHASLPISVQCADVCPKSVPVGPTFRRIRAETSHISSKRGNFGPISADVGQQFIDLGQASTYVRQQSADCFKF